MTNYRWLSMFLLEEERQYQINTHNNLFHQTWCSNCCRKVQTLNRTAFFYSYIHLESRSNKVCVQMCFLSPKYTTFYKPEISTSSEQEVHVTVGI